MRSALDQVLDSIHKRPAEIVDLRFLPPQVIPVVAFAYLAKMPNEVTQWAWEMETPCSDTGRADTFLYELERLHAWAHFRTAMRKAFPDGVMVRVDNKAVFESLKLSLAGVVEVRREGAT